MNNVPFGTYGQYCYCSDRGRGGEGGGGGGGGNDRQIYVNIVIP